MAFSPELCSSHKNNIKSTLAWQKCTAYTMANVEIRVVLWPQSTKTSVGPPDGARWWSGGLLENSP